MKRSIVGAVLAASLLLAPLAYAQTTSVQIGDPYTDTLQLWSEIASALSSLASDFATLFDGHEFATARPATPPAALAAAAANAVPAQQPTQQVITYTVQPGDTLSGIAQSYNVSLAPLLAANDLSQGAILRPGENLTIPDSQTASASPTEPTPNATSDQTTLSQNVKSPASNSAQSTTQTTSILSNPAPAFNASNFVTKSELSAQLNALTDSLSAKFGQQTTTILPQYVAADGNSEVPYAAVSNINNLSNVTITNANLTASEIPDLSGDYLSLNGGTLTGAFNDSSTATSTFSGNLSIGGNFNFNGSLLQNGLPFAGSQWTTNGSNISYSAGNVGIGTTSPAHKLSVWGAGASGFFAISSTTSGDIFDILSNGNVGVGTTSPRAALDVNGNIDTGVDYGYEIGETPVLYASTTNASFAIGQYAAPWLQATSSPFYSTAVGIYALNATPTGLGQYNTAVGYGALFNNTNGQKETANGYETLYDNTTGSNNTALGYETLYDNTTGSNNTALGYFVLASSTVGNNNTALGLAALAQNITGGNNTALGLSALHDNLSATSSTAVGASAGAGTANYFNQGGVYIGYQSGAKVTTGSDYNTFLGYQSGYDITSGNDNIFIGPEVNTGGNHITTGQSDVCIGYNCILPGGAAANNALNIGNFIFGTGLTATSSGSSIPASLSGNLGIGTASPYSRLQITGPDSASSTAAFAVVNSASTTVFSVFDGGNAELSGSLSQSSDERLKTNIQSLGASSSLSFIDELNPVTFNWIDPEKGTTPQLGFIAQQVEPIFPNLVSTTSATALTPDGTLSLNYIGLISPIVSAIQELSADIASIENTIAGFAQSITSAVGNFGQVNTQELCLSGGSGDQAPVCVTKAELAAVLSQSGDTGLANPSPDDNGSNLANPSPTDDATDTPPQIEIEGDNPAIIQVGDTYNDLGATIEGPQADLNLGLETFVNGSEMSPVQIDTSQAATDTIDYVATDQNGLTSTSTRTVIIESPSIVPPDASSIPTTGDEAATTSTATSTSL